MIAEISIHIASVHALRKGILDGWVFWRTPNGERRDSARVVSKLSAMGLLAGVPDLVVISPAAKVHFCEFKSETGTLDEAQRNFQLWCTFLIPLCSVDEAMKAFRHWGCIPELVADDPRP